MAPWCYQKTLGTSNGAGVLLAVPTVESRGDGAASPGLVEISDSGGLSGAKTTYQ